MKGFQYVLFLFLVLFGSSWCMNKTTTQNDLNQCGKSNPSGVQRRVVAGHTAIPGAWPWQALLLYGFPRRTFLCSGALINPSWILTAAHCIKRRSPRMYTVRLGDFDRLRDEGREQDIEVEKVIPHPMHSYPVSRNNDLALIKLKRPANITRWVRTVCLPTAADYLHKDLNCYATGWGLTMRSLTYSRMLQQAHVPLVTKRKCRMRANRFRSQHWYANQPITQEMLCGGDDTTGASTCMGDSGGPYVCRNPQGYWVLQGITSWGSRSCRVSVRYSVFTKINMFTKWIEKTINGSGVKVIKPPVENKSSFAQQFRRFLIRLLQLDKS